MPNNTRWKKDEEAILKRFYPHLPSNQIAEVLPLRSPRAIQSRANQRGITKTPEGFRNACIENWKKHPNGSGGSPKAA